MIFGRMKTRITADTTMETLITEVMAPSFFSEFGYMVGDTT